jgi:hypothetical protein
MVAESLFPGTGRPDPVFRMNEDMHARHRLDLLAKSALAPFEAGIAVVVDADH